jgi:hypothetical protein
MQNEPGQADEKQHQLDTHLMGASSDLLPTNYSKTASSETGRSVRNTCDVHTSRSVPTRCSTSCPSNCTQKFSQPRPPAKRPCLSGLKPGIWSSNGRGQWSADCNYAHIWRQSSMTLRLPVAGAQLNLPSRQPYQVLASKAAGTVRLLLGISTCTTAYVHLSRTRAHSRVQRRAQCPQVGHHKGCARTT